MLCFARNNRRYTVSLSSSAPNKKIGESDVLCGEVFLNPEFGPEVSSPCVEGTQKYFGGLPEVFEGHFTDLS